MARQCQEIWWRCRASAGWGTWECNLPASSVYGVVAIGRGKEAEALAKKQGVSIYLDSSAADAAAELQKMGGAQVILTTAPSAKPIDGFVWRVGAARQDGRGWGHEGYARSLAGPVDLGQHGHSRMGVGNSYGFRGHFAVCGDDWRASDGRKISAGEGERGVWADGEREGAIFAWC